MLLSKDLFQYTKLLFTSTLLLSTLLSAQTIDILNGWQLLGAKNDINVTEFDNSCVNYIWKYDTTNAATPQWQLHIQNSSENHGYPQITSIKPGEGFWVKGNASCNITLSSTTTVVAEEIDIIKGWQLLGAIQDISVSKFDGCVDFVWTYHESFSPQWQLHIANGQNIDYNTSLISPLTSNINAGDGFWIRGNSSCSIDMTQSPVSTSYDYRAWGKDGDTQNSQLTVMVNGVYYTLVAYSNLNIAQSNASTNANVTFFNGKLNSKNITEIFSISNDYTNKNVIIKVLNANGSVVQQTQPINVNTTFMSYDITVQNVDDYRPIQPTDTNIEMPPATPIF